MLSASLWGHLSRKRKYYLTEQETLDLKADYDEDSKYKIISYDVKENGEEYYKVIDNEQPYYYQFRLKPFITSYGRVKIAEMAIKVGLENVVRVCCDSICSLKQIDFKDEFFIPEDKTTGEIYFKNVNSYHKI
jgi:hypothetical protein